MQARLWLSDFPLLELPHTLSVSWHERQSPSHVKFPPKQCQHFTIRHRGSHPIRQYSRWGHRYVNSSDTNQSDDYFSEYVITPEHPFCKEKRVCLYAVTFYLCELFSASLPLCFLSCYKSGEPHWKLTDWRCTGQGFSLSELRLFPTRFIYWVYFTMQPQRKSMRVLV